MQLIVMFDLPTETKEQRKAYSNFRKDLLSLGFSMLQYSVYMRFCENNDVLNKYIKRIESFSPKEGFVRAIAITQKQYENMAIFVGEKTTEEKYLTGEQLTLFWQRIKYFMRK